MGTVPSTPSSDLSSYVNVFTGTENGGNGFPGVARPFGMVKLGPDLLNQGTDSYSGYLNFGRFSGFSMMHEHGTGGAPKYGTVAQLPLVGTITNPLSSITVGRAVPDQGSVGYYKAQTSENVVVELAATAHAGMYQYTFPSGGTGNNILVDVSHVLPSFRGQGLGQGYDGGEFTLYPDGHYEAAGIYNNGWNRSPDWKIYSCGYFNATPVTANAYTGSNGNPSVIQSSGSATSTSSAIYVGGLFTFDASVISSRVGISWISKEKACQNVKDEIPSGTQFSTVVQDTKNVWNSDVLSTIQLTSSSGTTTANSNNLGLLYTSLYFMNLLPTNQTGENPGWKSNEPYYSDVFTLWDTFRCSTSLMHVLQSIAYEEYIRALIDIWRFDGYMPDGRSSNYNGRVQGGTNADNVLADAYVKGVRGQIDWNDGYAAMVKDAEVQPANDNPDPMAPGSSTKEGRGALPDWHTYGYITPKYARAVSQAVEYAYNDFSLYQVAKGLGKTADADKYLNRSRNWRNHWNPDLESIGYKGFVVPRTTAGFVDQNALTNAGYWADPYYQASSWVYSLTDIHDMRKIIDWSGGSDKFLKRLETMFIVGANPWNTGGIIFDKTNEPAFNVPYLFNYVNRQDRSVYQSRKVAKSYNLSPGGVPGNSDAGAMQTWLLWNMIGLYPVTGQTTFLIHSPWFDSMTINLGTGKKLVITSTGGDGNGDSNIYVQSLKVNGVAWTKNWLTWNDVFANGGTLEFVLGAEAVQWATGELPPSPGTEKSTCSSNNCLRNLKDTRYAANATAFCSTYLERVVTAPTAIPTFIKNCDAEPTQVSSACSCIMTAIPTSV